MGEFTRQVQNDKIAGPLRRKFTPAGWMKQFETFTKPDELDKNVYAAALVIQGKLENIRSRLKRSTCATLSATTNLRALVAAVNHHFLVAKNKSEVAIAELGAQRAKHQPEGFRVEELTAVKLELPGGFEWSPNEIVEGLVDGIEVPVRFALAASPDLAGNPHMEQVEWGDIFLELNLGIFYRHVEDVWENCLWNDYKLLDAGSTKFFFPKEVDVVSGYSMGLARRFSLGVGFTAMATKYHRTLVARGRMPRTREVRGIERRGKRQLIAVAAPVEPSTNQEAFFVSRGLASEPYYAELLTESQTTLAGLSIDQLLDAWNAVAQAALILFEQVAKRHVAGLTKDNEAGARLPDYAQVLQVEALVQTVSLIAGVNRAESKRLIDFLTFRGNTGQEIWAQPLVPVGPSTVAPVFAATVAPNLRRLVDVWLRQLGVDLSRRGPAFEMYVRDMVQRGISDSKILSGYAWSIKDDYTFKPPNGRDEQIDLVLVIGSKVIVAEVKCILEPTDSKGIAMHHRTVLGAAEQANRKSKAIEANRAEFIADVKRFGIVLQQNFSTFPLVVVSTATHVGVSAAGVPVVDEYILGRFLDGEYVDVAMMGEELTIQKTMKTIFYSDAQDAEVRLGDYFSEPPQMERFKAGIGARIIPIHAIDDSDWTGEVLTLECVPKDIPLAKQDVISG